MYSRLLTVFIGAALLQTAYSLACGPALDNSTLLVFYPDSQTFVNPPQNPAQNPVVDYQGLRLTLTSTGLLQVLETGNSNKVLFSWGLANKVCTGGNGKGCKAVFQADGNFVTYYPDGSGIGTSTYNQNAAYAFFSSRPPYFSIVSNQCVQLWPNSQQGGSPSVGPLPRTTPEQGPTKTITVSSARALSASAWKASFGVNTHCSHGWSSSMVYDLTTYIGAGAIRDGLPFSNQVTDYGRMNSQGIKLTVSVPGAANYSDLSKKVQDFVTFQSTIPGMLRNIEGFNEINNFKFTYNNYNPDTTCAGMAQAQKDLYTLVKQQTSLKSVSVLDLTGNRYADCDSFGMTNYSGHADYGTVHAYAWAGWPSVSIAGTNNLFLGSLSGAYPMWNNNPINYVMSETGYHSDAFPNGVTEAAHGKMVVNTLLNGLYYNFRETYIYELIDETWAGYDGAESHFGVFRNDKSPKPAARALHFLSGLLNDSTVVTNPGTVSFTLSNVPVGCQYIVFQNSKSKFFVVLWNNAPVYDSASQSDISTSAVTAKIIFSTTKTVQVYDVYSTTASDTQPLPYVSQTTAATVSFSVKDTAVVLSF